MSTHASPPPANPDIKRELKKQLLSMSARSFEFFAGEFLVYVGLETVSVTRYIGELHHTFTAPGQVLIVFTHPSILPHPGKRSLHDPSAGKDVKARWNDFVPIDDRIFGRSCRSTSCPRCAT